MDASCIGYNVVASVRTCTTLYVYVYNALEPGENTFRATKISKLAKRLYEGTFVLCTTRTVHSYIVRKYIATYEKVPVTKVRRLACFVSLKVC